MISEFGSYFWNVRIFAYICHAIDDFACIELQH